MASIPFNNNANNTFNLGAGIGNANPKFCLVSMLDNGMDPPMILAAPANNPGAVVSVQAVALAGYQNLAHAKAAWGGANNLIETSGGGATQCTPSATGVAIVLDMADPQHPVPVLSFVTDKSLG